MSAQPQKSKAKIDWRQNVADEMIRQIEAGTAPWQKPWDANVVGFSPHNPTSDKPYKGINSLWLTSQGYEDPRWLTYKQATALGVQVRGGEKSTQIEYWKWTDRRPVLTEEGVPVHDENGKMKTEMVKLERPQVFYANVFNAEQIDGMEPFKAPEPTFEPIAEAEKVLTAGGVHINYDQNDRAFYSPGRDQISLPPIAAFGDAYEYYATALHELGHATGHSSRMNRNYGPFGSEVYAKEELRAELASYIVSRDLGLGHYPERHASYVESWSKAIKEDRNILFQAARDADQIATWIQQPELRPTLERNAQDKAKAVKMDRDQLSEDKPLSARELDMKQAQNQAVIRQYLAVPFTEKDQAKALGAKWDRKQKSWFIPQGVDVQVFDKWKPENQPKQQKAQVSPVVEFGDQLKAQGVVIKGAPLMDGKWHRASLDGDAKGVQNASYRAFLDGRPNGQIKNFRTDETIKWVAQGESLSPKERAELQAKAAETQAKRFAERRAIQNNVAKNTEKNFGEARISSSAKLGHPYLKTKKVMNFGLRYDKDNNILIPARDIDGKLWSMQTINEEGQKRFEKGGRKTGLMHIIDPKNQINEKSGQTPSSIKGTIFISEGYSTAATVHEAMKRPTVVAFDAGNLKPVAEAIRKQYPNSNIVIASDNDHKLENKPQGNVGLIKAEAAAQAVNGIVVKPGFTDKNKEQGLSDFNDLAKASGNVTVAKQIRQQLKHQKNLQQDPKAEKQAFGR